MQFQRVFYRYVGSAGAQATVAMGADAAPTTVFGTPGTPPKDPSAASAANVDNVLSCRNGGSSTPAPVQAVAVAMCGPTGATSPTANLYVWDDATEHWYLLTASPVTLPQNEVVEIPVLAPCEGPPGSPTQPGSDYMLVVIANGSPTSGQYSFAMAPVMSAA